MCEYHNTIILCYNILRYWENSVERITGKYLGNHRVEMTHELSGTKIITDAPRDHDGNGESFAPTDLVAASVGSCILTIMGIECKHRDWDMSGATVSVDKIIHPEPPRRIQILDVHVKLPKTLSKDQISHLHEIAMECPVMLTVNSCLTIKVHWD